MDSENRKMEKAICNKISSVIIPGSGNICNRRQCVVPKVVRIIEYNSLYEFELQNAAVEQPGHIEGTYLS